MASAILDAYGKPATYYPSSSAGGGMYYAASVDQRVKPAHADMFADFARLLPRVTWRQAVSDCRWIAQAFPLVMGAATQKADYASASNWRTFYRGRNSEWGTYAEEVLTEMADPICTTRSPLFDWRQLWWSGSVVQDTDGGFFINLTETETGFPQLQPIEAHRVGSWDVSDSVVRGGAYDGARILNGIIYDRAGREIAYRVLESDSAWDNASYRDVSARDMVHVPGRVIFYSEGRPLPRIAPALIDLYMAQDTRNSEQISQNAHSRLTFVENNETGKMNPGLGLTGNAPQKTAAGTDTEIVEKGFWRYVKNGGNLRAFESNRPSDQWDRFDSKMTATALFAMGWRAEMFDLSKLNGPGVNGFADQINTAILSNFSAQMPHVLRCRRYMVAKLIKRGDLPADVDWWKWDLQPPPEFTGNASRSTQSDIDAVRAGAMSIPELHRKWGRRSQDVLREQADYEQQKAAIASEKKMDPKLLGRLDLPGDNQTASLEVGAVTSAIRGGIVTPSIEIERDTRAKLRLPEMGPEVIASWKEDGVRRPVTVAEAPSTVEPATTAKTGAPADPNAA
jgi:capsid protein